MGLKVTHGVRRKEKEGDSRIGSCVIQDGDRMGDVGPGCTICPRTQI